MPSQTFQLNRPEGVTGADPLPQYTRDPKLPSYLRPRDSVAVSMPSYNEKQAMFSQEPAFAPSEACPTMIPQALLVDAATSLCAYLYFTSLQARMALQQQSSLDLLSTLCSSLPEDVDSSLLHTCAHAISHEAEGLIAAQTSYSHRLAIIAVLLKAFLGFILLTHASKVIKPFDYLVASGAMHCLMLYLVVFVPIASLMQGASMNNSAIWLRVMTKVLCLVALCCSVALVQWAVRMKRRSSTALTAQDSEDDLLESEEGKPAISLA